MRVQRLKRYYSAFSRYHASNGYGIHSPFAFNFVLNVLRERLPYYPYPEIETTRKMALNALRENTRHPKIISTKTAKLLFRVTNYFNPKNILLIGTNYGVSTTSMMLVSSQSKLTLFEPNFEKHPIAANIIAPFISRIDRHSLLNEAIANYKIGENENPFILINSYPKDSYNTVSEYIDTLVASNGVIIFRNLSRDDSMMKLWQETKAKACYGMSFSNEKISFLIINNKLQRQDFLLWF